MEGKVIVWTENRMDPQATQQTRKVRKILKDQNIVFEEVNINESRWSDNLKLGLSMITGYNSFPSIFFGKEHIGGIDDLQSTLYLEGSFDRALQRNNINQNGEMGDG